MSPILEPDQAIQLLQGAWGHIDGVQSSRKSSAAVGAARRPLTTGGPQSVGHCETAEQNSGTNFNKVTLKFHFN